MTDTTLAQRFHPDVLAAHAEFGGDPESMQALYDRPDHLATITRLTAANKALTAGETAYKAMLAQAEDDLRKAEAKLAKVEAKNETIFKSREFWLNAAREENDKFLAVTADRDRLSAELAEAQKREEHAIKAIEEALGWHQTTHIHMALRSFLASKEASHAE